MLLFAATIAEGWCWLEIEACDEVTTAEGVCRVVEGRGGGVTRMASSP